MQKLPSGKWRAQVYDYTDEDGKKHYKSFTARTKTEVGNLIADYQASKEALESPTVSQGIDAYIKAKSNILSPSTLLGYRVIQRNAFPEAMNEPLSSAIPWQEVVNEEALFHTPKTVSNRWGLISSVYKFHNLPVPNVTVGAIMPPDTEFLTPEQIQIFVKAIQGEKCELPALLALHSLRRSELLAVTKHHCEGGFIRVRGAKVDSEKGYTIKMQNKTATSVRDIPIMIPRLNELIAVAPVGLLVRTHPDTTYYQINKICEREGLPLVGVQGLRRSFASLAYHLKISERELMALGGWSNIQTVHRFYVKLSQHDVNEATTKIKDFYK